MTHPQYPGLVDRTTVSQIVFSSLESALGIARPHILNQLHPVSLVSISVSGNHDCTFDLRRKRSNAPRSTKGVPLLN